MSDHAPARDDPTAEGGWEAETDETGEGSHRSCHSLLRLILNINSYLSKSRNKMDLPVKPPA